MGTGMRAISPLGRRNLNYESCLKISSVKKNKKLVEIVKGGGHKPPNIQAFRHPVLSPKQKNREQKALGA